MKPLQGIRVLEWAVFHNGPAAGYMLGDLGADVIKIEEPIRGDPVRGIQDMWGQTMQFADKNLAVEASNRNKKGITLNLKHEKGREVLYRLVRKSDVFYTNFRKDVAARLGVDYETLSKHNAKIIYASSLGLGSRGPDKDRRSFDPIAQARSGIMWMVGDRDHTEPFQIVGAVFDQVGATMLAYGILAALVAKERLGIGQEVETSLLGSAIHMQELNISTQLWAQRSMSRHSRLRARNPMANHYQCADGKWLMLAEPQSDRFWHDFCKALRIKEVEKDPRFETAEARRENYQELIAILNKVFVTKTRDEWMKILKEEGGGLSFEAIYDLSEVNNDPQALLNEYIVDFDHPTLGRIKVVGCPVRFSKTQAGPVSKAPEHGEHTEEVLLEIGDYSWDEIAQFREEGVI